MKRLILFSFLLVSSICSAQLNMEFYSEIEYPDDIGNDVWGYVAPDGSEYAIMGTFNGVSVVNITDPRNPDVVDYIDQQGSMWRDIKTWGEFAYVTADEPGTTDGLLVIDLSNLPDSISYQNMNLEVPGEGVVNTCHNIYIDEFGFAYLAGCSGLNSGGLLMWDVASTPGDPQFAGLGVAEYSHDIYVRDNIAYSSEIAKLPQTTFSAYDVSDKSNVTLLGSQTTPGNATHNAWLSTDGNTIFTTDEVADAPVASYDVSDLSDIKLLDEYRPSATLNTGVVPHNVHVWDDWLIISYYTDGCIIVDAARPDNLIEVGNFDTFLGGGTGFNGAWGAYPFFPSGTVIVGEMGLDFTTGSRTGRLVVLGPTYVRASYLEGTITDAISGDPLNNVRVTIDALGVAEFSKANGVYKTGTHENGDFSVTVDVFGYESQTRQVTLENGELTLEDFQLQPLPRIDFIVKVVDGETGDVIPDAKMVFTAQSQSFEYATDGNGIATVSDFVATTYNVTVGSWGHKYAFLTDQDFQTFTPGGEFVVELDKGYEDVFSVDLGWETNFIGSQGPWERGVPIGHSQGGVFIAPGTDSEDTGNACFVTGNSTDFFEGFHLGSDELISPSFDVSDMMDPVLQYDTWFWVSTFNGDPDSEDYIISVSNGMEEVVLDTLDFDLQEVFSSGTLTWSPSEEYHLKDLIPITEDMRLIARISEFGFNSAVEGGFDNFSIVDGGSVSTERLVQEELFKVFPNPTSEQFYIDFHNSEIKDARISIFDLNGRLIETQKISQKITLLGDYLLPGTYIIKATTGNGNTHVKRVVKL